MASILQACVIDILLFENFKRDVIQNSNMLNINILIENYNQIFNNYVKEKQNTISSSYISHILYKHLSTNYELNLGKIHIEYKYKENNFDNISIELVNPTVIRIISFGIVIKLFQNKDSNINCDNIKNKNELEHLVISSTVGIFELWHDFYDNGFEYNKDNFNKSIIIIKNN